MKSYIFPKGLRRKFLDFGRKFSILGEILLKMLKVLAIRGNTGHGSLSGTCLVTDQSFSHVPQGDKTRGSREDRRKPWGGGMN